MVRENPMEESREPDTGFWEQYRAFIAATDLAGLLIDPAIFESARDRSSGPEPSRGSAIRPTPT